MRVSSASALLPDDYDTFFPRRYAALHQNRSTPQRLLCSEKESKPTPWIQPLQQQGALRIELLELREIVRKGHALHDVLYLLDLLETDNIYIGEKEIPNQGHS